MSILHVDDEPEFTETTATFLKREDERFVIETVTSASEGLDYLTEDEVTCSDYDMPNQNGVDFLAAVREKHGTLPFIPHTTSRHSNVTLCRRESATKRLRLF